MIYLDTSDDPSKSNWEHIDIEWLQDFKKTWEKLKGRVDIANQKEHQCDDHDY